MMKTSSPAEVLIGSRMPCCLRQWGSVRTRSGRVAQSVRTLAKLDRYERRPSRGAKFIPYAMPGVCLTWIDLTKRWLRLQAGATSLKASSKLALGRGHNGGASWLGRIARVPRPLE